MSAALKRRGQALVLVTLGLIAMFGIMGLAVDLGWSYYVRKSAQAAADAAALAAVIQSLTQIGQAGSYSICGTWNACQAPTACSATPNNPPQTNIDNACLYARQNGFANGGTTSVTVEAATGVNPRLPGYGALYWVTVRVQRRTPQLFSVVLGQSTGLSGARATAAIIQVPVPGALILLNRQNDGWNHGAAGIDLNLQGGTNVIVPGGGILLSSNTAQGQNLSNAGYIQGNGTVQSALTHIRTGGGIYIGGNSGQWTTPPSNSVDGSEYWDPMRGKGQPPPPTWNPDDPNYDHPIQNGQIAGTKDPNNPLLLYPGNYYSATKNTAGQWVADGNQISISGNVRFCSDALCTPNPSTFGNFVFFGGLTAASGMAGMKFDPGQYIFAGVQPKNNGPGASFFASKNASLTDWSTGGQANANAGELFIFTDTNYAGLNGNGQLVQLPVPTAVQSIASQLQFGTSGFQAGASANVTIDLHGLNPQSTALPAGANLQRFGPVVVWQDQRNSRVKYDQNGNVLCADGSQSTLTGCLDNPATNTLQQPNSPEMFFQGGANTQYFGVAYQPRGSWVTLNGGTGNMGPLMIVSGAMNVQGNGTVVLNPLPIPLIQNIAALIE